MSLKTRLTSRLDALLRAASRLLVLQRPTRLEPSGALWWCDGCGFGPSTRAGVRRHQGNSNCSEASLSARGRKEINEQLSTACSRPGRGSR